ncbi:hypothetical protein F0342_17890 [Bacillus sp. CH30_1T]|uniref:hypothetical protein n=1 Tax=Bacillus sp. CH30_1T TaxID=2604836 RepID=UPI0011F07157|nr:hypothetical protein [Bacillus sp. CH30_1T]KAA0562287.1 hypothetical protein F0342_17890 [Bacillus sp. CH30_1T]
MKKALILGATTILTLGFSSGFLSNIAHANENISNEITGLPVASLAEDASEVIFEVAPYVHKNDQGFLYVDSSIPQDVYIKNELAVLEKSFEEINRQVKNGQVVVNEDLSITNLSVTNKYKFMAAARKGYTSKTYWWGVRATYTDSQAKKAIKQLEDASDTEQDYATILFWLPPVAGIAGITGVYCKKLGKAMKSHNKGKGVILDMTWALTYKVKSR